LPVEVSGFNRMIARVTKAWVWALLVATPVVAAQDFVVVCPIEGMIDDGVAVFVERAVREGRGAKAIIFEVDTPGGLVDSAIRISQAILSAPAQTIAYVKGMGAISAGALISYSCDEIIMAPDTNMGAATPVVMSAEGMTPTGEKEVSFMRAKMRALAERHNRNPAVAEAMVDKDIELRLYRDDEGKPQIVGFYPDTTGEGQTAPMAREDPADIVRRVLEGLPPELEPVRRIAKEVLQEEGQDLPPEQPEEPVYVGESEVILSGGKLLTLTPQEAIRYGLISTTANTIEEVMAYYSCDGIEIRRLAMTMAEKVFRFLTNPMVSGLLLMLGIGGLYLELKTPGFGVPGILGLVCLALFFGSHYVLGIAEAIDLILILTGLALILAEVFLIPGFGVAGITGIACLVIGFYLSLTNVPIPQYSWDYARLKDAGLSLMVALVTLVGFVYVVWKLFPYTPFYAKLVLAHAQLADQGYVVQTAEQRDTAIGRKGVASTMLRPAGKGRFGDTTYQVVSRAEYLAKGTPIVIVTVDGNRYVVDRLEENG